MNTAIIAGHDSGLGNLISKHLADNDWSILGTSRRFSRTEGFENPKNLIYCDFSDQSSINACVSELLERDQSWRLLVISIGVLNPIGLFTNTNFSEWENSFRINFLNQIYFIHELLKRSDLSLNRKIITFAGSGTNSAPKNFSAYTLSKIALIKSMELLSVEYPTLTFVSLGTGWMNTPIHNETLSVGEEAGQAFHDTVRRMMNQDFGSEQLLLNFIDWVIEMPSESISGRNFSLQGDDWNSKTFQDKLKDSKETYKLRRIN
jgi:NAD(P)-dependent dehydrogenase (short-subunit alcohol dehydrogenase family)